MIVSQLLLSLFVAYWLSTQYQNEKRSLKYKLRNSYYEVRNGMTHRLTYEAIITPIIESSDKTDYQNIELRNLPLEDSVKVRLIKSIVDLLNENEKHLDKVFEYYTSIEPNYESDENVHNVVYGIQSAVYQAGITPTHYPANNNSDNKKITISIDEQLFRNLFELRLAQRDLKVDLEWIPRDVHIPMVNEPNININRYNPELEDDELAIKVTGYNWLLFKIITPQIIFILVLLSISAFALLFTYRSYIKQMRLNVLRSDFINNITHELKIPVATAKAALEALRSFGLQADPKITDEYMKMVAHEMNRLDLLTSRVLEHSKMEKQEKQVKFEDTNLCVFTQNIINNMQALFIEKKVTTNFICPCKEIMLSIDQVYMESVIKNLIDNSIKYGGENTIINVEISKFNNTAQLKISDNGPGIPEEYINKVFDKFFRVPKGDQHNIKGFGLGLSFVALVIKQHNGKIQAANLKPHGCQFIINLPTSTQL